MINRLKNIVVAATAAIFMSTAATAQVNLNMHTACSGTPIALTATSLVEQASQRGIANIQLKEGQTATNYIPMLAEGQIDDEDDFSVGQFLRPSLVVDADPSLSVVRDEQFGPTLPVFPYDSEDEVVAMANDSDYGLSSSVWSEDHGRAIALARRFEAGFTNINAHGPTAMDGLTPFGGVKQSGIGRNFGPDGVRQFQETHSISGPSRQVF